MSTGIQLKGGEHLDADIIITATGLVLQALGGVKYVVDGQPIEPGKLITYKGLMYSNVPNLIYFTGYFNASWTLKVDLVADYACRLLQHMDDSGVEQVTPRADNEVFAKPPRRMPFISGYILRAAGKMPRQGAEFVGHRIELFLGPQDIAARRGRGRHAGFLRPEADRAAAAAARRTRAAAGRGVGRACRTTQDRRERANARRTAA